MTPADRSSATPRGVLLAKVKDFVVMSAFLWPWVLLFHKWPPMPLLADERMTSALDAIAKASQQRAAAPAALLPGVQWSVVTVEQPNEAVVTIQIDGQRHHGAGTCREDAEANAIDAWRHRAAGQK